MGCRKEFCTKKFEDKEVWIFYGDGNGDFETSSHSADTKVVTEYMEHCKYQIELCEKYLKLHEND